MYSYIKTIFLGTLICYFPPVVSFFITKPLICFSFILKLIFIYQSCWWNQTFASYTVKSQVGTLISTQNRRKKECSNLSCLQEIAISRETYNATGIYCGKFGKLWVAEEFSWKENFWVCGTSWEGGGCACSDWVWSW